MLREQALKILHKTFKSGANAKGGDGNLRLNFPSHKPLSQTRSPRSHRPQPQTCGRAALQAGAESFPVILEALSKVKHPLCHCDLPLSSVKPMVACGRPQGCVPWLSMSWPCLLVQLPNIYSPKEWFPL